MVYMSLIHFLSNVGVLILEPKIRFTISADLSGSEIVSVISFK